MPSLAVKALVAALIGGLTSLPGALIGGLILGVSEAYFIGYVHVPGSADWLPFGLVVLALLFHGWRAQLPARRVADSVRRHQQGRPVKQRVTLGVLLTAVAGIPLMGTDFVAFVFSVGLIYGLVALSLSMLTGWGRPGVVGPRCLRGGRGHSPPGCCSGKDGRSGR